MLDNFKLRDVIIMTSAMHGQFFSTQNEYITSNEFRQVGHKGLMMLYANQQNRKKSQLCYVVLYHFQEISYREKHKPTFLHFQETRVIPMSTSRCQNIQYNTHISSATTGWKKVIAFEVMKLSK